MSVESVSAHDPKFLNGLQLLTFNIFMINKTACVIQTQQQLDSHNLFSLNEVEQSINGAQQQATQNILGNSSFRFFGKIVNGIWDELNRKVEVFTSAASVAPKRTIWLTITNRHIDAIVRVLGNI